MPPPAARDRCAAAQLPLVTETCAGPLDELVLYRRRLVRVGERDVAVFVLEDGTVTAIPNECPHYGVSLIEGRYRAPYVECPWHKWLIDVRTGSPAHGGPAGEGPAHVEVHDGLVYVTAALAGPAV